MKLSFLALIAFSHIPAAAYAQCRSHSRLDVFRYDMQTCPIIWKRSAGNYAKKKELMMLGTAAGAGVIAWQFNGKFTREIRRHENYRDFTSFGDSYGRAVNLGFAQFGVYLTGVAFKNDSLREFGILTTHSALLSGAFAVGLKFATNSPRPDGSGGGRLSSSFPSGHATGTAALAGTVQRRYGTLKAAPFHLASLYTGLTRIVDNKHRPYEVIAGWGLGYATGFAIARAWDKIRPGEKNFAMLPWAPTEGGAGLSFQARFGRSPGEEGQP
ncbi:MAG: hypothetical protein CO113_04450 [Elusimicrobia bacterium CG_4_9_14_3_um_filter_62_55]|nr:MAG: hypothetical protein COR54_00825 [Elusimicrobia bacterium CG22_combo_CG10-13_8_21_14_all_63_91]PJA11449.1 MAG: hypothetical protein COX66_19815 [Elusimicrobia bacterium CG_4_10_14_0_2_um_filter_63_34]PJB26259.1 MAG: hypothetical protein CO113_04450 [Elusimicrobia bacterium CG_4_9_14_3_um_filter_62_55]